MAGSAYLYVRNSTCSLTRQFVWDAKVHVAYITNVMSWLVVFTINAYMYLFYSRGYLISDIYFYKYMYFPRFPPLSPPDTYMPKCIYRQVNRVICIRSTFLLVCTTNINSTWSSTNITPSPRRQLQLNMS